MSTRYGSFPVLPSSFVSQLSQFAPAAFSVTAVFLWGASDFAGGFACRRSNAFVLTAFSHLCALVWMSVIAFASHASLPDRTSIFWAILAGSIGGFALAIFYGALAQGQMGLSAPIAALLGAAIPTMVDIALQGAPSRWSLMGFALAILAIWLITRPDAAANDASTEHRPPKGVAAAALAGVGFAGFYLCIHQATGSPIWGSAITRIGSFTATAVAVLATRAPLRLDRPAIALGFVAGSLDVTGTASFIFASEHGRLDEAVVITSLYPAITVLLARLVLKEHFSRWRFVGLLAALAAVPLIAGG
jgi:drug/metabolite transporter (DMT)-like permease